MRGAVLSVLLAAAPSAAMARPEGSTDVALSWGRRARPSETDREGIVGLGLHAALLGDRESSEGFAAGGALGLGTVDFAELDLWAGGALLVPLLESFPAVLTAAPLLSIDSDGARAGVLGRVGWGVHAFPRLGVYVLTAGLFLETRLYAGQPSTLDWLIGVDVDAFSILWPAMFLWEALFGHTQD